jgi:hypothetical protein
LIGKVHKKQFIPPSFAKKFRWQLGHVTSEIENAFVEALYLAFDSGSEAGGKEPTDLDIARVLTEFVPLSKLMAEQIGGLRNWAKGRARLATSLVSERRLRKIL